MANIYVGSVQYTAVAAWAALTAYVSTSNGGRGDYVRQLAAPASGSERVFRCTISGTSAAAEPAWAITKNATTAETAGPTWTECTGQEADQTAALWKAPHSHLENAFAATWGAAGDRVFLAHDDVESRAAARTLTSPGTAANPCKVICVNATTGGSMPPVSADLRTTGQILTTGANNLTVGIGNTYYYGVLLSAGSGAVSAVLSIEGAGYHYFKYCKLKKAGTSGTVSAIRLGALTGSAFFELVLDNTTLEFGSTTDGCRLNAGKHVFKDTASAIAGATIPTTLFTSVAISGDVFFDGYDLSAIASGSTIFGTSAFVGPVALTLKDCKIASGVIVSSTPAAPGGGDAYVVSSDSSGTNYQDAKYSYTGTQVVDTGVILTGGASNGTTGISAKITATANAKWIVPFEALKIATWNDTTAANVTATMEGLQDPRTSTALPTNADVWMELNYHGSAASPQATFNSGTKADELATGTALTASTQAWDSLVTARANTTVYALGAVMKVASNAGRVFICTTTGTSAGSEPAGYASAVDGGAVVDNTATFTAAVRFKQAITLSAPQPALKGPIYATVKVGKASGIYYIDRKLVLS